MPSPACHPARTPWAAKAEGLPPSLKIVPANAAFPGQNGKIAVLALEPKLKVLARNDMGEDCIGTPAIADGRLYIRTRTKLYCVGTTP